jgi:CRISPR/Cas system-associated exonuclease Cas4 (RecB family)
MAGNHACFPRSEYVAFMEYKQKATARNTGDLIYNNETKKYGVVLLVKNNEYIVDYRDEINRINRGENT